MGDVNIWMYAAGIVNIVIVLLWILTSWICGNDRCADPLIECEGGISCLWSWLLFLTGATCCFSWVVFGFLLWSDMDAADACSKMVLSWSIIESVYAVAGFCCFYLFL